MHSLKSIGYFISSHGFGHATRACAIMEGFQKRWSHIHFHIYSSVPKWFFGENKIDFTYHKELTDFGVAQKIV